MENFQIVVIAKSRYILFNNHLTESAFSSEKIISIITRVVLIDCAMKKLRRFGRRKIQLRLTYIRNIQRLGYTDRIKKGNTLGETRDKFPVKNKDAKKYVSHIFMDVYSTEFFIRWSARWEFTVDTRSIPKGKAGLASLAPAINKKYVNFVVYTYTYIHFRIICKEKTHFFVNDSGARNARGKIVEKVTKI